MTQARWARLALCVAILLALVGAPRGAEAAPASRTPANRTSAVGAKPRPAVKARPVARRAKVHVPHTRKAPHATKARAVRHSHSRKHGRAKKVGGKHGNAAQAAPVTA